MSPLAFGQRALLVAPDASRLHEVLAAAAAAISVNHPAARVVLAEPCAMPEDFPDGTADAPGGPAFTFCSTRFDDTPDKPVRLVSLLCESARRLVEGFADEAVAGKERRDKVCRYLHIVGMYIAVRSDTAERLRESLSLWHTELVGEILLSVEVGYINCVEVDEVETAYACPCERYGDI